MAVHADVKGIALALCLALKMALSVRDIFQQQR